LCHSFRHERERGRVSMAKYQSVLNSTWDDPVFQQWSPEAKLLFLNLITSARHNPVGLYAVSPKILMTETGLSEEKFQAAFAELQKLYNGYARVRFDQETSTVWIVNTLKHQPEVSPRNKNLIRHMEAILRQHAGSVLVAEFLKRYKFLLQAACKPLLRFLKGAKGASKGLLRGLGGASKGPNKSKDKEQGKAQDKDQDRLGGKGISKGKGFEEVVADHEFIAQLKKAYPASNVPQELEKMRAWIRANPNKSKKNWRRFVQNWISHAQKEQEERRGAATNPEDPRADRAAKLDALTEQVDVS